MKKFGDKIDGLLTEQRAGAVLLQLWGESRLREDATIERVAYRCLGRGGRDLCGRVG